MTKRVPKYQLIKTHTARRSFCTNAYKAGMDCLDIMALSGHTTEKSFLRYIKVTQEERARRIAGAWFFYAADTISNTEGCRRCKYLHGSLPIESNRIS